MPHAAKSCKLNFQNYYAVSAWVAVASAVWRAHSARFTSTTVTKDCVVTLYRIAVVTPRQDTCRLCAAFPRCVAGISCIGDNGHAVDWWVVMKQPLGSTLVYLDAQSAGGFVRSQYTLASTHAGAVANTINAAMAQSYVFYNDHVPAGGNDGAVGGAAWFMMECVRCRGRVVLGICKHRLSGCGLLTRVWTTATMQPSRVYSHSAGVMGVANDGSGGFVMPHTTPYFPDATGPYRCVANHPMFTDLPITVSTYRVLTPAAGVIADGRDLQLAATEKCCVTLRYLQRLCWFERRSPTRRDVHVLDADGQRHEQRAVQDGGDASSGTLPY